LRNPRQLVEGVATEISLLHHQFKVATNRKSKSIKHRIIMKARLILSWRTSILGVILLIVSIVLLFMKFIAFSEFTAFLPTILGLLYIKDESLKRI
jgi:hypothetical protein